MFRKLFLKYFPQESKSELSPINFHLKLIAPKLLYGISIKYWLENRRSIQLDSRFSYFCPHSIKFKNLQDEHFFYSYKVYSNLNWFDNYNIYSILSSWTIFTLKTYYDYLDNANIIEYINPILYSVDYTILIFFSRFKQYEFENDDKNLHFMLGVLKWIITHLEITKTSKPDIKKINTFVEEIINIFKQDPDFLMLLYNTTRQVSKILDNPKYSDIQLYNYLISGMMMDFPDKNKFSEVIWKTSKKIFLKRYTYYLDVDIITMLNMIRWDTSYISYLTNPSNIDFLDYFVDSLTHIQNIDSNLKISELVDKILNFQLWWEEYINALRDYNAENIDISIDPSIWFEKIQEMMSKEMMDNVKKVSSINEQFLDYYLLLINRKLNRNWDNLQFEIIENKKMKNYSTIDYDRDLYYKLDDLYFVESFYLKNKKNIKKFSRFTEYTDVVISKNIFIQAKKIILSDFNRKTNVDIISNSIYFDLLKKYFKKDITYLCKTNLEKNYLSKYYSSNIFIDYIPSNTELKNFRKNIYYPDFLMYNVFLKYYNKKFKIKEIINLSRLKESLFWYIIFQGIIWYSKEFENRYIKYIGINIDWFYRYLTVNYSEFIDFFTKIKQNKKFVDVIKPFVKNIDNVFVDDFSFVYDNLVDISYYNKRMFEM